MPEREPSRRSSHVASILEDKYKPRGHLRLFRAIPFKYNLNLLIQIQTHSYAASSTSVRGTQTTWRIL